MSEKELYCEKEAYFDNEDLAGAISIHRASSILLSFFDEHKNVLNNNVYEVLQKYCVLYSEYTEKKKYIKKVDEYIAEHRNTSNLIAIFKKAIYKNKVVAVRKEMQDIIIELIFLECTNPIQDILKKHRYVISFADEAYNRITYQRLFNKE